MFLVTASDSNSCVTDRLYSTTTLAKSHPNRTYYFRKASDVDKLIDACTKKLQLNHRNTKALYIRGSAYMKKEMLEQAERDFSLLIALTPRDAAALYKRGCVYNLLGKLEQSVRDFTLVLILG